MDQEIKRKRFLMLSATSILVAALLLIYLLGSVLVTVLLSAIIAYVLLPLANFIVRPMPWRETRPGLSRGIAIGLIYAATVGIFIGVLAVVIPPTVEQIREFIRNFPTFFNSARTTVEGWVGEYRELVPDDVRVQIEDALANMGGVIADAAWEMLPGVVGAISGTFSLIIGLATLPILVFYMVKDSREIATWSLTPFPKSLRPYITDLVKIVDKTIGGYLRGQLILGLAVGTVATIGLLLLDIPFAVALGVVAGVTELIPIVGPWIGAAAAILVTLAVAPEKVIWVALFYLAIQLVENTVLVPRIQAESLNLHPIAVILVIILAGHFFGILGIILGPPLVSLGKSVIQYLAHEWDRPPGISNPENSLDENTSDAPQMGPESTT